VPAEWSIAGFFGAWGQVMTMGTFIKKHELQQKQQLFVEFVFMWFNN